MNDKDIKIGFETSANTSGAEKTRDALDDVTKAAEKATEKTASQLSIEAKALREKADALKAIAKEGNSEEAIASRRDAYEASIEAGKAEAALEDAIRRSSDALKESDGLRQKSTEAIKAETKAVKDNTAAKEENANLPDAPDSPEDNRRNFRNQRREGFIKSLRRQRREQDETGRSADRLGRRLRGLTGRFKGLAKGAGIVAVLKGLHLGLKGVEKGAEAAARPVRSLADDLRETKGAGASAVGAMAGIVEWTGKAAGATYNFFNVWGRWREAVKTEADALRASKKAREEWIESKKRSAEESRKEAKSLGDTAREARKLRVEYERILAIRKELDRKSEKIEEEVDADNEKGRRETSNRKRVLQEQARLKRSKIEGSDKLSDAQKEELLAKVDQILEDEIAKLGAAQRRREFGNNKRLIDDLGKHAATKRGLINRREIQLDTGAVMNKDEADRLRQLIENLSADQDDLIVAIEAMRKADEDHLPEFQDAQAEVADLRKKITKAENRLKRSEEILKENRVRDIDELKGKHEGEVDRIRALEKRVRELKRENEALLREQETENTVRRIDRRADRQEGKNRQQERERKSREDEKDARFNRADSLLGELASEARASGRDRGAKLAEEIRRGLKEGNVPKDALKEFLAAHREGMNGLVGVIQQELKSIRSDFNTLKQQVQTNVRRGRR